VSRRWWLILIPVLLDTLLWLGPQISIQELVQDAVRTFETELASASTEDIDEWFQVFEESLLQAVQEYNSLSALRVGMLGLPSLLIWGGAGLGTPSIYEGLWVSFLRLLDMPDLLIRVPDALFVDSAVWQLQSQGHWFLLNIGLTLLGVVVGCIYLTALWHGICGTEERRPFWPQAGRLGRRFVVFWVLRALVLVFLAIPFALIFAFLSALDMGLALLFTSITLGLATWLSFYGNFVLAAMVVNDAPVGRAIWNSIGVVLRHFWSTLWLFALINLIGGGLTILWQQLSQGSWSTWLAIVGNAFVGTSLIAASMLYYQDRYASWQEALAELLAKQQDQRMA
jgi:hypothetical protein